MAFTLSELNQMIEVAEAAKKEGEVETTEGKGASSIDFWDELEEAVELLEDAARLMGFLGDVKLSATIGRGDRRDMRRMANKMLRFVAMFDGDVAKEMYTDGEGEVIDMTREGGEL